jgi:diaminohydroxyphosphoribosylaminopyrimidine deaminase / 5-amino-6-(5-phosphoribosylamino)uracil reductase
MNDVDITFLSQALTLAHQCDNDTAPNPKVGCILVDANNTIIGKGRTQHIGGPHAEIMALRDAEEHGFSTVGACAYVTLEPCAHHGKTSPCCEALIDAKISKTYIINIDPNPIVNSQGIARMRLSGIAVDVLELLDPVHPILQVARAINIGFFSRMERGRPWVRIKIAASLDGRTALPNGQSQWITGEESRFDAHLWRARSCAVLTGVGTVLADNPRLDVRHIATNKQPAAIVIDSHLRTPPDALIFSAHEDAYIYTCLSNTGIPKFDTHLFDKAHIISLPQSDKQGRVDLVQVIDDLAKKKMNEILIEAGATLNGSFLEKGLVDELILYLAPKLLGSGAPLAALTPITKIAQAAQLSLQSVTQIGSDICLRYACLHTPNKA